MTKEVKEFCETYGLTVEQFYGREVYKGSLYLRSIVELPQWYESKVNGKIHLKINQ